MTYGFLIQPGSTDLGPNKDERARRAIASVAMYPRYAPSRFHKPRGLGPVRTLYCAAGASSNVRAKLGIQHGFPQEITFQPPEITKREINYTEEKYCTRERAIARYLRESKQAEWEGRVV